MSVDGPKIIHSICHRIGGPCALTKWSTPVSEQVGPFETIKRGRAWGVELTPVVGPWNREPATREGYPGPVVPEE